MNFFSNAIIFTLPASGRTLWRRISCVFLCSASYLLLLSCSGLPISAKQGTANASGAPVASNVTYSTADYVYPPDVGFYNVKSFGAQGDGTTDDTAAIRSAITAALTGANQVNHGNGNRGSTVYFPAGTYVVTDSLMWIQPPATPAQVRADLSNGCLSGFSLSSGGSGYRSDWNGVGVPNEAGLWITGGGGSGIVSQAAKVSGGSISGFDMRNTSCAGRGYTSTPSVQVVNWRGWLRFEGQNKSNTTIRLHDASPGFVDGNCSVSTSENIPRPNCKAVVYTSSDSIANATGAGEAAYGDDIWNLTIDTGHGNAGAIALDWTGSNRASVKNVNLISEDGSGRCGLNVSRSDGGAGGGPGYVKNLSISGYDYGINANSYAHEVGYTFEYIHLAGQHVAGMLNANMPNWFRQVSSINSVPVFINSGAGLLLVVDGNFTGGSPSVSAIENRASTSYGVLFARNISTAGYQSALATSPSDSVYGGNAISEYADPAPVSQFSSDMTSLDIPNVPNTPEWVDNDFSDWADVSNYDAASTPNSWRDATAGIQAAMNSGKPVIFFPYGEYITSATIHIPGSVRKIIGSDSKIVGANGRRQQFPTFSCDSQSGNTVEIRNFFFDIATVGFPTFLNNCSSDLVIADVFDANGYRNTALGTGTLYLENTAFPGTTTLTNQRVFARQLDSETRDTTHVTVSGGQVWIFGFKTEQANNLLNVSNANFELLGQFSSAAGAPSPQPAFLFNNSNFSLSAIGLYANGWPTVLSETRNGSAHSMGQNNKWVGTGIGLYSGHN